MEQVGNFSSINFFETQGSNKQRNRIVFMRKCLQAELDSATCINQQIITCTLFNYVEGVDLQTSFGTAVGVDFGGELAAVIGP